MSPAQVISIAIGAVVLSLSVVMFVLRANRSSEGDRHHPRTMPPPMMPLVLLTAGLVAFGIIAWIYSSR